MTISLKHSFQSTKADSGSTTEVSADEWNAEHAFTMAAQRFLGRLSAGSGSVEELTAAQMRANINNKIPINSVTSTTSYTPALSDAGSVIIMNATADQEVVLPASGSVAFTSEHAFNVTRKSTFVTSITAASTDVTVNGVAGGSGTIQTQHQSVAALKIGSGEWNVGGDISSFTTT